MPPGASSELSLLAQQLEELSGGISSRTRTRRAARAVTEIEKEDEEEGAPGGLRVAGRRQGKCISTLNAGRSRSSGRRFSSNRPGACGDVSSRVLSSVQPKWTATSLLRFFSNSISKDKELTSPATAERENGSADTSFATAADLRLVRQAAAAAAERCLPAAARPLSPCLAPYYSPVLHPFWIAQQDKAAAEVEEEEADENELEEEAYMGSFNEITSSVPDLRRPDDIGTAGALAATRLRGRSSSRRRKFLAAHRAFAQNRRRCKSQRELLQQELPQQSPEAAAAAAAALLSCNSFNSYRIASVVPPAPGRGTWTDETNLGELLPLLLPEQYKSQREEQQQLQQMLLPLQQERHAKLQTAIRDVMQQELQVSLLPQEIFDLNAFPAAAEPKAAGASAGVDLAAEEANEEPLQLPLTTEQLVALLQGRSTNAPGGAGGTSYSSMSSSSSCMPADLSFQRSSEEEVAARGQTSADVCDRRMESESRILSRAFVSASFAAAAATAEAEAERVAAQPLSETLQQQQLKVRFEQQQLLDEELEQLPIEVSSSDLSLAAAGTEERTRLPAIAVAATGDVPAAVHEATKETESEEYEEFPFTSRTPIAAALAAEAAAADAAGVAKREAASLSAACDVMGRLKLQQVWGAAAAKQQQMRLLEELQHQKKQQKLIEAEVKAIDGLQQELDTWQADLTQQQHSVLHQAQQQQQYLEPQQQQQLMQQQLMRQQQMADETLQQLQPVQEQQDSLVELQARLQQKPDISLIQETSQERQEKPTVILLQQNATVSRAFPCTAAAAPDWAPVAGDSVASFVAAAVTCSPGTTTATHDAARAAAVTPIAVTGAPCHIATAGAAPPRTAASALTAATSPAAAAVSDAVVSGKQDQQRSSSQPPHAHSDTKRSLNAATRSRRSLSTAAGVTIASLGDVPQVHDTGESAGAAASHVILASSLQRSSGPIDKLSGSRQQQQQQQQQQKQLQHHHDFRQGQIETQQVPLLVQQQARLEGARDGFLTAVSKTAPQLYAVAAIDTAPASAADAFQRGSGHSAETDGTSVRARSASTFPASDSARTTAVFNAAAVPLVAVAASHAASSSLAASARAGDAALTEPPAVVAASEPARAVATASAVPATDTIAAARTMPSLSSSSPCIKLVVKRPQQQELRQQQQQRSQQSQQQLPQQQLQPLSLQKPQPHRREEQQYVLRQQPLQQTSKVTVYSPNKMKSRTPQTTATAVMPRGVYASESISTLPSGGRANSSRTIATTAPAVHPADATVIREWRIVNGVATPVLQTLSPAFIGAGAAAAVGHPSAAAHTAPPPLVSPAATKAGAITVATAFKPVRVKKASLFEKLWVLLGGGSSSSCTECVCSSGAASTTGKGRENELQKVKGMSVSAAPAPLLWLPQDPLVQAIQWQLPYQQHVQQQQQNTMMSQGLNEEKGYQFTVPSSSLLVAPGDDARRLLPLSYPSALLPASSTLPTAHKAVELHVSECKRQKPSKEEVQPHTPCEDVPQEAVWQQHEEGRLGIPAFPYWHADASTRGAATRPGAVVSSAPPQVPIYIPVVDKAVTAAVEGSSLRQAGLQRDSKVYVAAAGGHHVYSPVAFAASTASAAAAVAAQHRVSDSFTRPTATAASSATLAASAASATFEPEQQQQYGWRSDVPLVVQQSPKRKLSSYPSVSISKDGPSQWRQAVLLQEGDDASMQPGWERQQQIAFQQQLPERRRQQDIRSKPTPGELQQQILPKDKQREAKPYLLETGLSRSDGAAEKQSDQDYQSTVPPPVSSAAARGSSKFSRLAFNDLEERLFQTDGGKHKVADTLSRGREKTLPQQRAHGDAAKKSKSKVPDNWIRFGAEIATTEEDTDAVAAAGHIAAGHITAKLTAARDTAATSEAWLCRNQRRQRRCPDDIKKRWLQQHPEHQSAVALDVEFAEQQRKQQLQVTQDLPQTGVYSEQVQRLLQQRRLLQQQRQRLLKQQRQRSTRELEPEPMELVLRAELQQQQLRRQQLHQQEQARERLQHRQQQQQEEREHQRLQQKRRLGREHVQDREDREAKEQQPDTEKACVYPVASAAEVVQSPPAAVGTEYEEEGASPTELIEYEQPMANEEAAGSFQWSRNRKSSKNNSLDPTELLLQQRQLGKMDNNGSSSASVVAAMSSEEAESAAAVLPREAAAEAAAEARAVDKQTTPTLEEAEGVKAEETAAAILIATETASDRSKEAEQRGQERTCEARDTAAAAAAAHIAAIAATKAARAADAAIAVLAAATVGTTVDVFTLQRQQQRQMADQCAGVGNDLSLLASRQLPVRYTRSKKGDREETILPEVERKGYAGAAVARVAEAVVDAGAVGSAQVSELDATLHAQSYRSLSAAPAVAAQVESVNPAAVREKEANGYGGGVGNPKAAAAATAAAAAAAAEAAREAARRAAANIQEVAAVVAEPLQPLQHLFSFCTGGSNTASRRATRDKREVPAVANSTYGPAYYYNYEGAPSSLQRPLVLRYWYNTPAQQQEGDEQQQVRSYYYASPVMRPGEPPSVSSQGTAAAALEAPSTNERESNHREADAASWRPRSVTTAARHIKRGIQTKGLYDYPLCTQQRLDASPLQRMPEAVYN